MKDKDEIVSVSGKRLLFLDGKTKNECLIQKTHTSDFYLIAELVIKHKGIKYTSKKLFFASKNRHAKR